MRIPMDELVRITSRISPRGQASWFKKHFGLDMEYDRHGVIITGDVLNRLIAKKYGVVSYDLPEPTSARPALRLNPHHA